MKMRKILVVLLALTMLFALVACNNNDDKDKDKDPGTTPPTTTFEPRTLRLADNQPEGYPTVLGDQKFAELVKERTGGAITIEVYSAGVLGDEKTTLEQVQFGALDFIRVGTNSLAALNPDINALSLPYLYRDTEHMFKVLDGEIGEEYLSLCYDQGLLGLCWFDAGARHFYNSKKEIHTPADMSGLKIRVQETALMMTLVESLGASPTPMAFGEVYSGIQTGLIDGAENNWPSYMAQSHNEVAKYITVDAHTRAPEMILIATGVWESFSKELQDIIKQAAMEAAVYQRQEWASQEADYEQQAKDTGSTITRLSADEFQLFVDAVQPVYELPDYVGFADIVQKIRDVK